MRGKAVASLERRSRYLRSHAVVGHPRARAGLSCRIGRDAAGAAPRRATRLHSSGVWTRATTEARARIGDDGEIIHLMPALYHGRRSGAYRLIPLRGDFLTFTEFGRDIVDYLREAGFEPEVYASTDDVTGAETAFAGPALE